MQETAEPAETVRRRGGRSKGDEREEQILASTRHLLSEKSMNAVTIDDIARAAGISRTSFYFYFPSKQAVLAQLMEQVSDRLSQTHAWLTTPGPSPQMLREQLEGAAAVWRENAPILACSLQGYGEEYPPLADFLTRTQARFVSRLAAKIDRDRAVGLAPDGIDSTRLAGLIDLMRDGRLSQLAPLPEDEVEVALDELVEAILRLIYGRYT